MLYASSDFTKCDNIRIRAAAMADYQRVSDFMNLYFSRDEPLSSCRPPGEEQEFPKGALIFFIERGTCMMAVLEETDELVGVAIGTPKSAEKAQDKSTEAPKRADNTGVKINKFLTSLELEVNLCERYNVQKVLCLLTVCVKTEMRGKSVGALLCKAVYDLGKQLGFELLASDCTSLYSARMQERLGWECVNTVYYKDYLDEDGQQVFKPPKPHECCKTYVVRL